jgi:uncharacterized protein YbjT (DUF2867 family)
MTDEAFFSRSAQGTRAIYHICPNVSSEEIPYGKNAITAAQQAGVRRFIFHSVLHPQIEYMPHHWAKMRVEEMLFETDLDWTILQPTAYMQNLLTAWNDIKQKGVFRTAYGIDSRISLIDLGDLGEVAAKVLTEDGHEAAIYELVGTPPHSQTEVATVLGKALGWPVKVEGETVEAWQARARANGMAADESDKLAMMSRYYQRNGLIGNANVLSWLLGRPPTTLAQFARSVDAAMAD